MTTSAINTIVQLQPSSASPAQEIEKAAENFQDFLATSLQETAQADQRGNQAIVDLNTGKAENLHDVMLAMEEADISIRMLVQFRNKALEAYNEIMKLQL